MTASTSDFKPFPFVNRRTVVLTLLGAALGVSAAAASYFMREPRFLATLVLRVGEVGYVTNAGLVQRSVERPHEMVERLRYEHRLKGTAQKSLSLPYLSRVRLSRTDKNLVILEAHGAAEKQANDFLQTLGGKLIDDHGEHFSDAGDLWAKRHNQLRKHVRIIDGVIDKQLKALDNTPTDSDQIHAVRLMQMGILTSHRAKADEDLHLLNVSRSRIYTKATRILQKPEVAAPVGLSIMTTCVVGGLAGAALGCLLGLLGLVMRRETV